MNISNELLEGREVICGIFHRLLAVMLPPDLSTILA